MLSNMRTTVTLDPDTELLIRRVMKERRVSFKVALNDAIRAGDPSRDGDGQVTAYTVVRRLGRPTVPLERALQLSAELEDEERVRKMRSGR